MPAAARNGFARAFDMPGRLLALVVAVAAVSLAAVPLAGRLLVVADPLPPSADAIVVLAGSIPARVLEAADLYRAGLAPRIVVTRERLARGESALHARGVHLPESDELTISALDQLGIPRRAIVRLRRRARSTESEARTVARYACSHRLRRLVIVTSPGHVRRDAKMVLYEYERLLLHWLHERWTIKPCGGLRRRPTPRSGRLNRRPDERRELTPAMHLAHDVAAADELSVHVELRDGRPV